MNFVTSAARNARHTTGIQTSCTTCMLGACSLRDLLKEDKRTNGVTLARGQRLETAESGCLKFWVIVSGTAATCIAFQDGRRQIAAIETPGQVICGPMAQVGTEVWLEALSDTEICEVDLRHSACALARDSEFMRAMFTVVHTRLENALTLISMLGRLDSRERVLLFLAEMAARSGGKNTVTTLPMSREDIADYLGLNTETVSRVFTRIRKSGLVKFITPTEYLIPDMAAVKRRLPVEIPCQSEGART